MPPAPKRTRRWYRFSLTTMLIVITIACMGLGIIVTIRARKPTHQVCIQHLRMIGLAMHNYHAAEGAFPPAFLADAQGKPLVSWRMLVVRYDSSLAGTPAWYQAWEQHRDEPWDGPNNSKLHDVVPDHYHCPLDVNSPPTHTSYLAITGPETMWPGVPTTPDADKKTTLLDSLLIVEVKNSGIHWMEPRDLDTRARAPGVNARDGLGISSNHRHGACVCFADGRTQFLDDGIHEDELQRLIVKQYWQKRPRYDEGRKR